MAQMVTRETALPDRPEELPITDEHYVLKNKIKEVPEGFETAIFATGCFWGSEKRFWTMPGVHSTAVIYGNGFTKNPTYRDVCTGRTGHAEGVRVVYNPEKISFADLLKPFFESHDPTQGMRQGGDSGTQYRSGIYVFSDEHEAIAQAALKSYEADLKKAAGKGPITTEIAKNVDWYYAEDYHQQYLVKPGNRQYCSAQPSGVPLAHPSTWELPADIKDKLNVHDSVWAETYDACMV